MVTHVAGKINIDAFDRLEGTIYDFLSIVHELVPKHLKDERQHGDSIYMHQI
jgi:hypothetical protein